MVDVNTTYPPVQRIPLTLAEAAIRARDYWRRARRCFAQHRLHRVWGQQESARERLRYFRQFRRFAVYWAVLARELRP